MKISRRVLAIPAFLMVVACGGGEPASVDMATEKLREGMTKDDYSVTWINVVEKGEPGKFRAFIDRVKEDDPDTNETQLCNASVTTNSSSWTCSSAKPSIMVQAANMLMKDYATRKIEVRDYHLERTGDGNAFRGYLELVDPNTKQLIKIPCKGNQKEAKFDIDCNQSYNEDAT